MRIDRPTAVRVLPFAAFMLLLAVRSAAPSDASWGFDTRWLYGLTVLVVGAMLAWCWRDYAELARRAAVPSLPEAALAVAVGAAVFGLWIQLDAPWMTLGSSAAAFVPVGADGALLWPLVAVRWAGAALLVPVMEELFWRSYLMRWIDNPAFQSVDPQRVGLKAVLLSTAVFMLAHTLWLAAIVAGLAYAWLYRRTGRLWTAVLAHAVTNGLLGAWVVATGNWQFW